MKWHSEITVACDRRSETQRLALATRGMLEALGFSVRFMDQKDQILSLLSGQTEGPGTLVLWSHGVPDEEGGPGIRLEYWDRIGEKTWGPVNLDLTAAIIPRLVRRPFDLILSTACSAGDPTVANAFLSSGVRLYVAPEKPADLLASLLFVASYFYHVLETPEDLKHVYTHEEAVRRAAALEEERPGSTRLYRSYPASTASG
jgi:hypothetical protein